jgi:hypothetical protein
VGDLMIDSSVELIDRNIIVALTQELSPAGQSAALAAFAQEQLDSATEADAKVLGDVPDHETFVGSATDDLSRVRPDGVIVFDFDILTLVVRWIEDQLITHSPVRTGRYQQSHRVFVDGAEVDVAGTIAGDVKEIVFAPLVSYARRIEAGWSKQTPDGVYQVIAAMARQQFHGSIDISFGYREIAGVEETAPERQARPHAPRDLRQPAIIIAVS